MARVPLRQLLVPALLALGACTEAAATRVADRTFQIDGPGLPSQSDAPNRRFAERVCPNGYQVIDQIVRRNTPDGHRDEPGIFTNWTIHCL